MESLKTECDVAKKKCKDAQEKYFSESDRLKAIIDEMQGMALSLVAHFKVQVVFHFDMKLNTPNYKKLVMYNVVI